MRIFAAIVIFVSFSMIVGCSPLKSSPHEEKHQLELTIHELKTNLDDVRHDLNCFQTELQILDGRIKYYENALTALKQQDFEKQQSIIDQLAKQVALLEKKYLSFEQSGSSKTHDLEQLTSHANETSAAMLQFKQRITELEQEIHSQNRRFDEVAKLKTHFESLTKHLSGDAVEKKTYKVRPGDTLDKIARQYQMTTDQLKKINNLDHDRIVVGQELLILDDSTQQKR